MLINDTLCNNKQLLVEMIMLLAKCNTLLSLLWSMNSIDKVLQNKIPHAATKSG